MLDFSTEMVGGPRELSALAGRLGSATALALDIETVNWWDREAERVSLVQLAFREQGRVRVAVVDALAAHDLKSLREPLESGASTKAIHNAAYDASRLARHFHIHASPIHDTMLAARRGGERRCSLQAQAETHLGVRLDKGEQRGDWSQRPLTDGQLRYAALDAACTLLLYEHQLERGLAGGYRLREASVGRQTALPLDGAPRPATPPPQSGATKESGTSSTEGLQPSALALLGVVAELPGRYSPDALAVSVGGDRVGLAGWIIDRTLGAEADIDEDTAKLELAELCARGLVGLDESRRLAATPSGASLWRGVKSL